MKAIKQFNFSTLQDGGEASLFRLSSEEMQVDISNYGAAIVAIRVKDRDGNWQDVVLGFDTVAGYEAQDAYFGVVAGRYANRIAKGRLTLNGNEHVLATNNGENHLHGGIVGFSKRIWDLTILEEASIPTIKLFLVSPDGEEGYPGTLKVEVTYALTVEKQLQITYQAISDSDTVVNLTNHSYFNLNGHNSGDVLGHNLYLNASSFVRVDGECIPTGELPSVVGTPFDFTNQATMHSIGERIHAENSDLACGNGYDHSFVLRSAANEMCRCATLVGDKTGIQLDVDTDKPAVQLYTGNSLNGSLHGKENCCYQQHAGVCLETQFYPDSPNHKNFPNCVLEAGKSYLFHTNFSFSVSKI